MQSEPSSNSVCPCVPTRIMPGSISADLLPDRRFCCFRVLQMEVDPVERNCGWARDGARLVLLRAGSCPHTSFVSEKMILICVGAVMCVSEELLCSFELLKPLDASALKQHMKKGDSKKQ